MRTEITGTRPRAPVLGRFPFQRATTHHEKTQAVDADWSKARLRRVIVVLAFGCRVHPTPSYGFFNAGVWGKGYMMLASGGYTGAAGRSQTGAAYGSASSSSGIGAEVGVGRRSTLEKGGLEGMQAVWAQGRRN